MDKAKLDQLKNDIASLATHTENVHKEVEKFCLDLSIDKGDYENLISIFDKARGSRLSTYNILEMRFKARTRGRETNAKVFAQKYLGREVMVDSKFSDESFDGIGIVSGYLHMEDNVGREYPYALVELPPSAKASHRLGASTAGTFSFSDKSYTFLRDVNSYYYWHPEELVLTDSAPKPTNTGDCECGADKYGWLHSSWCPKPNK